MTVKSSKNVEDAKTDHGIGVTKAILISDREASNFLMRRFTIQPGGYMPKHTNTVEHEQYVLQGEALVGIGDETYHVRAGDVLLIPENIPHFYQNLGSEPFQFLCLVPNKPDVTTVL